MLALTEEPGWQAIIIEEEEEEQGEGRRGATHTYMSIMAIGDDGIGR